MTLGEYLWHDLAVDIGQAVVAPSVAIGKARVIEAHQVQNSRVEVVHMDLVLNGVPSKVVGRPMGHSAPHPAPGHPHGETERMMLATIRPFSRGRATEFASP